MFSPSRRKERRHDIVEMLKQRYRVQDVIDYSGLEPDRVFLEGTGAMVLDHIERVAYAARSNRTNEVALERFCTHFNFEPVVFDAPDTEGRAIYHTNVLMCIGTDFALIGLPGSWRTRRRPRLSHARPRAAREAWSSSQPRYPSARAGSHLCCRSFFRRYPDIAVDLHLTDAQTDLIGEGYDAVLRIAVLEDSSLVARLITPVRRFLVASPAYIANHGAPQHPRELADHRCASYANRAKRDVWRFTHQETGEETLVTPAGPLRGTSAEALLLTVLAGLAITELPEFIATQYFPEGQLEPLLPNWRLPEGGLYFVTPTARARPAKVSALADFLIAELADACWRANIAEG